MRAVIVPIVLMLPAAALAQSPIRPGLWEVTSTITDVSMPGAPPQMVAAMKGRPTVIRNCVTPADAAKGPQELLKSDKSCRFTRYNVSGGKIDTAMTCNSHGGTMDVTSSGNFGPAAYTVSGTMAMKGAHAMTMKFSGSGKLVGSCK